MLVGRTKYKYRSDDGSVECPEEVRKKSEARWWFIPAVAGPILLIVGLPFLFATPNPNTRQQNVNNYNSAVTAWNSSGNAMAMQNAVAWGPGGSVFAVLTNPVVVKGNMDGVDAAISIHLDGPVALSNLSLNSWSVAFGIKPNPSTTTLSFDPIPSTKRVTKTVQCSCHSTTTCYCNYNSGMAPASVGCPGYDRYVNTNSNCKNGDTCGTCYGTGDLTNASLQIYLNGSTIFSIGDQGITYPFVSSTIGTYTVGQPTSTVQVSFYASTDPTIMLSQVTKGTNDFGLTQALGGTQTVGLVLTIVGGGLIFIALCCWCFTGISWDLLPYVLRVEQFTKKMRYNAHDGQPHRQQTSQRMLEEEAKASSPSPELYGNDMQQPIFAPVYGQPAPGGYGAVNQNQNRTERINQPAHGGDRGGRGVTTAAATTVPSQLFFCPITLEVMRDPVITKSGNTYERAALEEALRLSARDPLTREPCTMADITPNRALKEAIEVWHRGSTS